MRTEKKTYLWLKEHCWCSFGIFLFCLPLLFHFPSPWFCSPLSSFGSHHPIIPLSLQVMDGWSWVWCGAHCHPVIVVVNCHCVPLISLVSCHSVIIAVPSPFGSSTQNHHLLLESEKEELNEAFYSKGGTTVMTPLYMKMLSLSTCAHAHVPIKADVNDFKLKKEGKPADWDAKVK